MFVDISVRHISAKDVPELVLVRIRAPCESAGGRCSPDRPGGGGGAVGGWGTPARTIRSHGGRPDSFRDERFDAARDGGKDWLTQQSDRLHHTLASRVRGSVTLAGRLGHIALNVAAGPVLASLPSFSEDFWLTANTPRRDVGVVEPQIRLL